MAVLGLCVVVAFFVFWPALNGPFIFDDNYQFWAAPRLPDSIRGHLLGVRPLLQTSYYLNYLLSGPDPSGFHLVNILLHALNSALVGVVLFLLLKLAIPAGARNGLAAVLGAGLFLIHPVQSEAVSYISARSDLLCSTFFLLALATYLWRRPSGMTWLWAGAITVMFGLALGSKEIAIGLPAIFLVIEWLFHDRISCLKTSGAWRLYATLAIIAAGGLLFILRYLRADKSYTLAPSGPYFYTQWRAIARYLQLLVWPAGMNLDYDFPLSKTPLEYGALWCLLVLIAVVGLLIWRRDKEGLVLTGLAILIVVLAPTSSFMPIQDPIAERRMYLPMLGVSVLAAAGVVNWKGSLRTLTWSSVGLLAILALVTYRRAELWGDAVALWQDTAQKSPNKFRPQFWIGHSYMQKGNCPAASAALEKAERLRTATVLDAELQTYRAFAFGCMNQPEQAAAAVTKAMEIKGEDAQNLAIRGNYWASAGKVDLALADLNRALQLDGNSIPALSTRGKVYLVQKRPAEAIADLEKASKLAPHETQLIVLLAQARSLLASQKSPANR